MTVYRASFDGQVIETSEAKGKGRVVAIVSAFNVPYPMGARRHEIQQATFADGLPARLPIFWQHGWAEFDGGGQPPIADASVEIISRGLKVDVAFYLDSEAGRNVFAGYRSGALRQWSIGYRVIDYRESSDGDTWTITKGELLEASAVLRGANPGTRTEHVAAASASGDGVDLDAVWAKYAPPGEAWPDRAAADAIATADAAIHREETRQQLRAYWRAGPVGPGRNVAAEMAAHADNGVGQVAWSFGFERVKAALAATDPLLGHEPFIGRPALEPAPQSVLSVIPLVPHDEGWITPVTEGVRTGSSTGPAPGADLPLLGVTFSKAPKELQRYGNALDAIPSFRLDSAGQAAETYEKVTVGDLRRSLARDVLIGAGTNGIPNGIKPQAVAAGKTFAATAGQPVDALARAAGEIGDAGFADFGLVAVVHATTLTRVIFGLGTEDPRAALPTITRYIATPHLAAGEAIVGEFAEGCELIIKDIEITMTASHGANFTKRLMTIATVLRQYFNVRQINAFRFISAIT